MNKRDAIIILLLLLLLFIGGYFLFFNQDGSTSEVDASEQIEDIIEVEDQEETGPQLESSENEPEASDASEGSDVIEKSTGEQVNVQENTEVKDEVEVSTESVEVKSDLKFGYTLAERSVIWEKYHKRQNEIIVEAKKINADRFSKPYLNYENSQIKKLKYQLQQDYKLRPEELDYIINEGKNGKFKS